MLTKAVNRLKLGIYRIIILNINLKDLKGCYILEKIPFIITNIIEYEIFLGLPLLNKNNLIINITS